MADLRGEWELNLCPERLSLNVDTEKDHMVQDPANTEDYTLLQTLTSVQVHDHEEVLFHACLRLVKFLFFSVQFLKNAVCVILSHDALSCLGWFL